jgi:hypothetical protein
MYTDPVCKYNCLPFYIFHSVLFPELTCLNCLTFIVMYSVYYPFMSCVIAYLFIHTIVVSVFVLCIYLFSYFFKILCSAVPRSLISYRVIISSNGGCGQVKECQWRLAILTLFLTFAQLSASPEKVFFVYGKCRLYVESVVYFCATFIARIF